MKYYFVVNITLKPFGCSAFVWQVVVRNKTVYIRMHSSILTKNIMLNKVIKDNYDR